MSIVQVGTYDICGGAERVAWNLCAAYEQRGHDSWLVVGRKRTRHPRVLSIAHHRAANPWSAFWWSIHERLQPQYRERAGVRFLCRWSQRLAAPRGWLEERRGIDNFRFPGARRLLEVAPRRPDVVHCHNLHGGYFDLRVLPELSRRVPVVLTLHDAWLLGGHCAHSLDCERWLSGCGQCPDLTLYPPVRRDATALNWRRKQEVFSRCRLNVAAPCRWLMDRVNRSILAPGIRESRIIPYGVDLDTFKPADRRACRDALGLAQDAAVLVFSGYGTRRNIWKDYATMHDAVGRLAGMGRERPIIFLALGEAGPIERLGASEIRLVPFVSDPGAIAKYYQAADLYVHAARADTFPNSVLEALACGTPVVATATGGIPEQIRSVNPRDGAWGMAATGSGEGAPTGLVVPPRDPAALAAGIAALLDDGPMRQRMAAAAAADARQRFGLERQAEAYLEWYAGLLAQR